MKVIRNLFSLIFMTFILSGCFLFPSNREEAEKHKSVCLDDEIAIINCGDPFSRFICRVDCQPNNDKVSECIELASKINAYAANAVEVIKECKSPITRWK